MTRTWRLLALAAGALLVIATLGTLPGASAARVTSSGGPTTVTVMLRAPHPAELRRQGTARHLDKRERVRRPHRLLPARSTRLEVARRLRHLGLDVVGQSLWSVTARGTTSQVRRLAAHPRDLGSAVSAAVPDTGPLLRPMTATTGQDYRDAYAPIGATRDSGTSLQAAGTTVATIQFANFDPSDLTDYATSIGRPDPVASGQFQSVVVGTGPRATDPGAIEVALDQESILATAPLARQRAYFAPNSFDGFVQAFDQVRRDAATVRPRITAVSVSWGACESDFGSAVRQLEPVLQTLNLAGVTVFNSSGDSGAYCQHADRRVTREVSYPASSPNVVAVGGTSLTGSGPNDGRNWAESGWSCVSRSSCAQGGSGGGSSDAFPRPDWQSAALGGDYATGTRRLVPDIAAVSDPGTGFVVLNDGIWTQVGGTSLAAPVVAALFGSALATVGATPPGDIHAALYGAYRRGANVFRDVVTGQNAAPQDAAAGTSACAATGYDTVTGLGAVLWPALVGALTTAPSGPAVSTTFATGCLPSKPAATAPATAPPPPGPTANAALTVRRVRNGRGLVLARWATVQHSTVPLASTRVVLTDLTSHRVLWRGVVPSGVRRIAVRVGHRLRLQVTPLDANGAGSPVSTVRRVTR